MRTVSPDERLVEGSDRAVKGAKTSKRALRLFVAKRTSLEERS